MNKLFGASLLVLGMAISPAFAGEGEFLSDNEVNLDSSVDSYNDAMGEGAANAAGEDSIAIEDSLNKETKVDVDLTKTDVDNKNSFNTASLDVDASKTKIDASEELKVDASKETKLEDSQNNASGDASANASGDDSESHLNSDNKTSILAVEETKIDTDIKTEVDNKGSFNTKTESKTVSLDLDSTKDSHDTDNSKENKPEDSLNNASGDGSANASGKGSESHLNSDNKDVDVDIKKTDIDTDIKDSYNTKTLDLAIESNKVTSVATLASVATGNKVEAESKGFGNDVFSQATASMDNGANSNWAGLNQVSIAAGNNNVAQMSQQVTASIRNLEVH